VRFPSFESSVNPKSTSNQSSKPCTVLQYPSKKRCARRNKVCVFLLLYILKLTLIARDSHLIFSNSDCRQRFPIKSTEIRRSRKHRFCVLKFPLTGWRRLIGCLKLRVIFRKRATNHRALLRKMTYNDKASYDSKPPRNPLTSTRSITYEVATLSRLLKSIGLFCKRAL